MTRLRTRLIAVFLLATLVPLGLTIWTALRLLDRSLALAPFSELDELSQSLQKTGREVYQQARESLRRDAADGRVEPRTLAPAEAQAFRDKGAGEQFEIAGVHGERLEYYVIRGKDVMVYSRVLSVPLRDLTRQYAAARATLENSGARNWRRGFSTALLLVAAV